MWCSDIAARRRAKVLAAGLAGAALSACASTPAPPPKPGPAALTPTEQFPIKVSSAPERIALAVHPSGLSPNQKAALSDFVSRWRSDGGGAVTVATPPGVPAGQEAAAATAYVVRFGVPSERVQAISAPLGAPILLAYQRFHANGPDCTAPWDDLTATGSNKPYNHFGCAVTANLAAQVANPRDFLAPAVMTPADDTRREVVLGKYRLGEITASAKDDQANGKVSDQVK